MNEKKTKSSTLLNADIEARFADEKKLVTKVSKQKQNGKATMIIISVLLAIVVLGGILVPLFQ